MANNIPLISIPAPVIQFKNDLYLTDGQFDPKIKNIPCGENAWVDDLQHWFIPIKDFGIVNTEYCEIVPAVGDYPPGTPPTFDSLLVLRIRDKFYPGHTWWVVCTIAEYYASCQTCCDDAAVPIPTHVPPVIIPCQKVCEAINGSDNYFVVYGAPDLGAGEGYLTYGAINGVELNPFESTSLTDLLADLNTNFGTIISPARTIVWTRTGNIFTGTFQGGLGIDDSFCLLITNIAASP